MKYIITIISDFNSIEFESASRNSKGHLRENGGKKCIVKTKNGKFVSAAEYSDEFGYYYICE